MIINEIESKDLSVFHELCKEFYDSNVTLREYDEDITNKTFKRLMDHHENLWGFILIDAETNQVVGYSLITSYWCNEEGGEVLILDELFIKSNSRKKGYAGIFMKWLEERFNTCVAITLEVLTSNLNAQHLYDKIGYKPDGYVTFTKRIKS